jgi:hypothetical protein
MLLILLALVVVIGLLALRPWARASCDWVPDSRKLADGRDLFTCQRCGAEQALPRGQVPQICLAPDRPEK